MSISIRNTDLVLKFDDDAVNDILNKYDTYLEALYNDDYSFHRDAVKSAVGFLLSEKYKTMEDLAKENYLKNPKIKDRYPSKDDYLSDNAIPLRKFKACSMDLATGSGKSFLMFGIAQVMLCEQAIDKVLVLCPSLTIEEGLTDKFKTLNSRKDLVDILKAINPKYVQPEIKNASETILPNDICIENIHATYQRTGSSIQASFKSEGQSVLVMNDEAHHIFSGEADSKDKKWIEFLKDKEYNFKYIVNVTGTTYYGSDNNDYFNDVIYRFGLKQAVDKGIVKKVDPKTFDEYKDDKGYQQIWAVHQENIKTYGKYVKPISIVVCASIAEVIIEWNELVKFISEKEKISFEEAATNAIWVTSGLPGKDTKDGKAIAPILSKDKEGRAGESIRKDNLKLLKSVDNPKEVNPVEWIISVAMLTEGWDVKNVFQVVPHKQKAFNSKLLIAQVLGRGLRIPQNLKDAIGADKIFLKVNNHEKWNHEIQNLYNEILELENRLSWGYDKSRSKYAFKLHNLKYEPKETTKETKKEKAQSPKTFGFNPQRKVSEYKADFQYNSISYVFEEKEVYGIDQAVTNLYTYLKDKDPKIAQEYPKGKLKTSIQKELKDKGYENDFLSKENYLSAQQAFGPMFRETGKEVPRVSNVSDALFEINPEHFPSLSFSEDSLKRNGFLFYTEKTIDFYKDDEKTLFKTYTSLDKQIADLTADLSKPDSDKVAIASKIAELASLQTEINKHLQKVDESKFKTSLNSLYVSYTPEIEFAKTLFLNIELVDAFLKSADKGFYGFPYSYKPETKARTHVKNETFNPDFFLKVKGTNDILVIETKKKDDDSNKNKAKYRDGKVHFDNLNKKLEEGKLEERYYFKFLSDDGSDIAAFFQSIKDEKYKIWKSTLMNQLEK
ncbi:MAG: DEAD/DEAH box helicase family protein [Bacteroidetes bacterium]|nr:DEAD/DEAH box helicase family protein [Bacteroidota bacterium]